MAADESPQGFQLSKGIIGNLSTIAPDCISKGDCSWCDFISLMVILQKAILSIFGGIALILIIWGGISIVTAAGNEENIAANKKLVTSTLMGVLIVLGAYFLVHFIVIAVTTKAGVTLMGYYSVVTGGKRNARIRCRFALVKLRKTV